MIKLPGWWTPREVADLYRVHTETVYRWIRIDKLPATRLSRNLYRIKLKDVLALAGVKLADEDLKAVRKQTEKGPPATSADVEAARKAVREQELDERGHLLMGEGE